MARRNNEIGLYGLDAVLHTACALRESDTAEERILVTPPTNRSLAFSMLEAKVLQAIRAHGEAGTMEAQ